MEVVEMKVIPNTHEVLITFKATFHEFYDITHYSLPGVVGSLEQKMNKARNKLEKIEGKTHG